jgi:hypothetical protein
MTEVVTIDNEELAILCDIVSGWGVKKWAENPGAAKKQALDRLIAHGYVEPAHDASATYPRILDPLSGIRLFQGTPPRGVERTLFTAIAASCP